MNCSSVMMLTFTLVASLAVLTSSATQFYASGRYGKRAELPSGPMFWTGSRYGRSSGGGTVATLPGGARLGDTVEVAARNERFFGGSRYGKRGVEQQAVLADSPGEVLAIEDETSQVTCLYTGVTNLYRCYNRKENTSEESPSSQRAK